MNARLLLCPKAITVFWLLAESASGATITVTGTGDTIAVDGVVTLREAITSANNDPAMELHDSNGALVDSNDNWVDSPNKQEIINDGLAPANALESAIARTVNAPESYTAIVRGVNNGTGIGVVEVFAIQAAGP